jgi:hypothetical protein
MRVNMLYGTYVYQPGLALSRAFLCVICNQFVTEHRLFGTLTVLKWRCFFWRWGTGGRPGANDVQEMN